MDVMARRRAIMAHIARLVKKIISSVTGLVSFVTNVVMPTKVVCEFSPIQEGTGDPSPDNVRPISGWTGCEIGHAKKNLFDKTAVTITTQHCINYTTGGITGLSTSRQGYTSFVPIKGDTTYTISGISFGTGTNIGHAFYSSNDASTYISGVNKNSTGYTTFTTPSDAKYARFSIIVPSGSSAASQIDVIQLELGSSATTYEAYQGSTKTINWQSSAGTVYGGTVTLNEDGSADLVSDMWIYTVDGGVVRASIDSYNTDTSTYVRKNNFGIRYKKSTSSAIIDKNISDSLIYAKNNYGANSVSNSWANAYNSYTDIGIRLDNSLCGILATDTYAERVVKVNAYLADHPITVGGELETPQSYHFPNIGQLQSFLGTNNLWHDMNGSITAEYYKKQ